MRPEYPGSTTLKVVHICTPSTSGKFGRWKISFIKGKNFNNPTELENSVLVGSYIFRGVKHFRKRRSLILLGATTLLDKHENQESIASETDSDCSKITASDDSDEYESESEEEESPEIPNITQYPKQSAGHREHSFYAFPAKAPLTLLYEWKDRFKPCCHALLIYTESTESEINGHVDNIWNSHLNRHITNCRSEAERRVLRLTYDAFYTQLSIATQVDFDF
jgi:hypothetical protein